jgi:hypothetical protein
MLFQCLLHNRIARSHSYSNLDSFPNDNLPQRMHQQRKN